MKTGARVALASRNAAVLEKLATDVARRAATWSSCRPTSRSPRTARDWSRPPWRRFGGLDLLINNAGVGSWGHFATSTPEIMRQVMEVNFFAPVELTRVAMPHLTNGNQSAVVNIASMCGRKGMPAWPEYSASKYALVGISEALRGEFARFDVDVITVVPGLTNSGFEKNWLRTDGRANLQFETRHDAGGSRGADRRRDPQEPPGGGLRRRGQDTCCASTASSRD